MKCISKIAVLLCLTSYWQCKSAKTPQFDYPDDIVEANKKAFVSQFKQGEILYKMNCAACHNKKENGKDIIPVFSLPQLMDYEMRIQYSAHQDSMKEARISNEELEKVVLFLRYRKANP